MRSQSERNARLLQGALSGGVKGGAAGAFACLGVGAAVLTSAPAWFPVIGGSSLVFMGKVAAWSAAGACLGAATGGAHAWWKHERGLRAFAQAFPDLARRRAP